MLLLGRPGLPTACSAPALQYCEDLECPLPFEPGRYKDILQWMMAHAVGLEYADHGEHWSAPCRSLPAPCLPTELPHLSPLESDGSTHDMLPAADDYAAVAPGPSGAACQPARPSAGGPAEPLDDRKRLAASLEPV